MEPKKKSPRPEDKEPLQATAAEQGQQRHEPHFKIMIAKVDKLARNSIDPVPVSVNGVQYAIRRGMAAYVPACVVEALRNAEEINYEAEDDNVENRQPSMVQSYPFQILDGPMPADVARSQLKQARESARETA